MREMRVMGLEYLLLATIESEGPKIIAGYPKNFSEDMDIASFRSFPLSASGGEVVKFSHGGLHFVGITIRLGGEKPRAGIASLLAVSKEQEEIGRLEMGLSQVYKQLSRVEGLTKGRLEGMLASIFKALEEFEAPSEGRKDDRGLVDKAIERSRGLFFM